MEIRGHDVRSVAAELAGFGGGMVVEDLVELRGQPAGLGEELVAAYRP